MNGVLLGGCKVTIKCQFWALKQHCMPAGSSSHGSFPCVKYLILHFETNLKNMYRLVDLVLYISNNQTYNLNVMIIVNMKAQWCSQNLVVLRTTDTVTLYTFCSSSLVLKKYSVKETHTIFVYFNSIEKVFT